MVYGGLVRRSRPPSASQAPRTNVVLPEPSSPATVTRSPSTSRAARPAASASVSSGDVVSVSAIAPKRRVPRMPAYLIVETDIFDPVQYEKYKAASPGAGAAGGGRFVVRGGELAVLEADRHPKLLPPSEVRPPGG